MSGCERYQAALVEIARGQADDAEARRHAAACGACAARLFDEQALTRTLHALAAEEEALEAPAALEARLRAAVAARAPRPAPQRVRRRPLVLVGLAASALLAAFLLVLLERRPAAAPASGAPAAAAADEPEEFAPLVYGEPLDGADALHLTRVRVPRSALASFGWRGPVDDGPPVEADVLVGQDGVARGIRFVSDDGGFRR